MFNKKLLSILAIGMILIVGSVSNCFAYADQTTAPVITDTSDAEITDYSLTNGVAVTTAAIPVRHNSGFATLLIVEDKAGGTGDVDISIKYSIDSASPLILVILKPRQWFLHCNVCRVCLTN